MLDQLPAEAKTVDGVRRLMKQLCEALDALSQGVSIAAPDTVRALLALRKDIVPAVDERLTKCAELIRRGLRDEAASYAAEAPDLVQVATLLDVSRHSRWKIWLAKLTELNILAPAMPRMDLVSALTKAQDDLIRLKPLLDAWRRMNLANASLADRISILGKLRKADPENELWFEALREHQKQRVPGLEREVAAAIIAKDDQRLIALVAEMQQEWIERVPLRIVTAAKAALEKFRSGRIERELDSLAASLEAAREARDLDAARTLRERWRELEEEKGAFAVDDPRLAVALPAVGWVDAHARMAAVSEEIWNSLDASPGGLRMRQGWVRSLERLGDEMEDLAERLEGDADVEAIERAHERIGRQRDRLDRDVRFRRMIMYVGVASAAVVLGLVVWYFDDRARYDRSVAAAVRELRETRKKVASGLLLEIPDYGARLTAEVAGNPDIARLIADLRDELGQQNGRRERLGAAMMKAAEGLRTAEEAERPDPLGTWPTGFADAGRSLAEIEQFKLALTDQEQADVTRVKSALDRLGRNLVGVADDLCRKRIADFDADLGRARNLAVTDGDAATKILETVRPAVAALREQASRPAVPEAPLGQAAIRVASEPIVSLLSPNGSLLRNADAIDALMNDRKKFRDAINELDGRLGDWARYGEQLEAIARQFTDVPDARDYERAAESKAEWQAIDEWRIFEPRLRQLHLATPEQARETVAAFESLTKAAQALPMAKRVMQDVIPAVKQLAERDLAKLRTECSVLFSGAWLGELKFAVKAEDENIYYCLEPPPVGALKFTYVSGPKDTETGWPTKDARSTVESVAQSPQAKLADALRTVFRQATLSGGTAVDDVFVKMMDTVVNAKDVEPIARVVIFRKFLILAVTFSRPFRDAGRPLVELLDDGENGIPGLNIDQIWSFVPPERNQNPEYQVTKQKAVVLLEEIARGFAKVKMAIDKEQKLLLSPPVALAMLAGRLGRNEAGELIAVWRGSAPPPGKVFWFRSGGEVALAGTADDKGAFRAGNAAGPAGTPLYFMTGRPERGSGSEQQPAAGREE